MAASRRTALGRIVVGAISRPISRLLLSQQQLARRDQFVATGAPEGRVVFLGDSISEFGNWEEWFPEVPVLNRGIGGETAVQVRDRLDTAIASPLAVLLLIGTNDLLANVPISSIALTVEEILDGIERRAPGTPIVLQSVMPRAQSFRDEIQELNSRYAALAASSRSTVQYLDLWPALATSLGALRPEYTRDQLHLNGIGYRAWVDLIDPTIAALLSDQAK